MASETQSPQLSSAFERLLRHRDLSLFLPFILGLSSTTTSDTQNPDQEATSPHDRIVLINPFTQGMVVIEGTASLDSFFRELASKNDHPPASKASIEALPSVDIQEMCDRDNSECAICLEEWDLGDGVVVKEMPCKHRFHGNCIDKWLGIHGSCPVCRYKMPVDDDDDEHGKRRDQPQEEDVERRRIDREIWISVSFSRNTGNQDHDQTPSSDSSDVNNTSAPNLDHGMEA